MKEQFQAESRRHSLFCKVLWHLTLLYFSCFSLAAGSLPEPLLADALVVLSDSIKTSSQVRQEERTIQTEEKTDSIFIPTTVNCGCDTSALKVKAQRIIQQKPSRRACKRTCRETKRQEKRACKQHKKQFKSCKKGARKTKRACKKTCKKVKKAEIKACKGKRGKAKRRCKRAARKKFRKCKRTCRANKRATKKACKKHKRTFRSCKKTARKKARSCRKACRPVWCCSYCDKVAGPVHKEYRNSRFWAYLKCMWNGSGAGSCDFMGTKTGGSSLSRGKCPKHGEINY